MKTKKSEILLSAALFVLLFSACGNKDPEVEPTPVTPEPMVKKYLVEQYLEDPNRVTHKIEVIFSGLFMISPIMHKIVLWSRHQFRKVLTDG